MRRIASLLVALASLGLVAAQPPPEDRPTEIEGVEVTGSKAKIPLTQAEEKALEAGRNVAAVPQYSTEQIASLVCAALRNRYANPTQARRALEATEHFEAVKLKVRQGEATLEDLVTAEVRRQNLVALLFKEMADFTPNESLEQVWGGLEIDNFRYTITEYDGRLAIAVSAELINRGAKARGAPPLTIVSLDRAGLVLADETFFPQTRGGAIRLEPNKPQPVRVLFENMPLYTRDVVIHYGPGRFGRAPRNCLMMKRYEVQGDRNDAAQSQLDAAFAETVPVGDGFVLDEITVDRVATGDRDAIEIAATLTNSQLVQRRTPRMFLVLFDDKGAAVGLVDASVADTVVAGKGALRIRMKADEVTSLPAAAGRDPLKVFHSATIATEGG